MKTLIKYVGQDGHTLHCLLIDSRDVVALRVSNLDNVIVVFLHRNGGDIEQRITDLRCKTQNVIEKVIDDLICPPTAEVRVEWTRHPTDGWERKVIPLVEVEP